MTGAHALLKKAPRPVVRAGRPWTAAGPDLREVYRAPLEEPLPAIRVFLHQEDRDVPLEIQPLIDQSRDKGACEDLDCTAGPSPPLSKRDASRAREILRSKGLRG